MELGATMELFGGRGKSTLGKKTPLYSGGINPTVTPPQTATHRVALPLGQGGTTAEGGTTALTQRYFRADGEVRVLAPERFYRSLPSATGPHLASATRAVVPQLDEVVP